MFEKSQRGEVLILGLGFLDAEYIRLLLCQPVCDDVQSGAD